LCGILKFVKIREFLEISKIRKIQILNPNLKAEGQTAQ